MKELYKGKPLMGENGIFTPLLKHILEAILQGEMGTITRRRSKLNPTPIAGMVLAKNKYVAVWANLIGPPPRLETPRD